jgi:hypothetical protein
MEGEGAAEAGAEVAPDDAVMAVGEGPPAASEFGEEDIVAAPMVPAEAHEAVAEMVPESALEAVAEMVPEVALEAPQEALGALGPEAPQVHDPHSHAPAHEEEAEMVTEAALEASQEALGAEVPDAVQGTARTRLLAPARTRCAQLPGCLPPNGRRHGER